MTDPFSVPAALDFVEREGVVLASAKGDAPRLIEVIAGEAIAGNWWTHPRASAIYNVLAQVCDSDRVLVCRLLREKVTLVHRRLWPALVRLAPRFSPRHIARVEDEHTPSGRHATHEIPFPHWVPVDVMEEANALSEEDAVAAMARWLPAADARRRGLPRIVKGRVRT